MSDTEKKLIDVLYVFAYNTHAEEPGRNVDEDLLAALYAVIDERIKNDDRKT